MSGKQELALTVGKDDQDREVAIITTGGHPQRPGSGPCTVLTCELVDLIPNRDTLAWFIQMTQERPWETRQ